MPRESHPIILGQGGNRYYRYQYHIIQPLPKLYGQDFLDIQTQQLNILTSLSTSKKENSSNKIVSNALIRKDTKNTEVTRVN